MKARNKRKQAGFTLIEMMVVVAVIGLLIAMVGPRVFNQVEKAERTRVAQDIRVIENALKFYRLDNFRYPTQSQGLEALVSPPAGSENWNGPYLDAVPNDPWKTPYLYSSPGSRGKDIDVYTYGADGVSGGEGSNKDWGNWNVQ
ncbi:MAG: type II secretion system major pseudopilin GspG [Porticoccaceae bacterium]|jgi:general secretion pathway protein G